MVMPFWKSQVTVITATLPDGGRCPPDKASANLLKWYNFYSNPTKVFNVFASLDKLREHPALQSLGSVS